MIAFLSWFLFLTLLGWLTFPLAYYLFPALTDRGYTFSRAFGLLVWAYTFWLFASFGIAQNDIGGLLLGIVILGGLSVWAFLKCQTEIRAWVRQNRRLIVTTESFFFAAFALMAFVRSTNPEIFTAGGEKWMETAFITAILHSPTFPPHDPWLSGYAISYYYFGYVMTAMLAKFTGVSASVAHNLMLSLIFSLSAIGAYGLLYNLLSAYRPSRGEDERQGILPALGASLGPLFLLLVSNLEGFFESLHSRGIGWTFKADGSATSSFWRWIDLQALTNPPTPPLRWVPDQFFWWWRASRVIQDYDLNNARLEIIDEFPFFSYLLGDLHPHVLAMPFDLLAIAVALNLFFGGWRGRIDLFFGELKINKTGFFTIALVLGGLAFLNTWDILLGAALIVLSYALARVQEDGWDWERLADVFLLGVPAVVAAFLLYLPFYVGFSSQAGGILPSFMYPTRGAHLWVMWGTLFIPLFAYLIYSWRNGTFANWRAGTLTSLGIVVALLAAMFMVGLIALKLKPDLILPVIESQGRTLGTFLADTMLRRLMYIGSLLTLLGLLIPSLSFLFRAEKNSSSFILLMVSLAVLLILGPDFLYLRDNFGYRINTVFKFYYQAWILLSLAAAFGLAVMWSQLRGLRSALFTILMILVMGAGLVYPAFALPNKTDNFKAEHPQQRTLNGEAYLANSMPDDYQAIQFMKEAKPGVVAEAVGGQYSDYARISTFSGLPAVLGWPGHESQWRKAALQGSRKDDIQTLYTSPDWVTTQDIIKRYNIRYIVVGNLERQTYQVNEEKFNRFLKPIFQQGSITVYEVP